MGNPYTWQPTIDLSPMILDGWSATLTLPGWLMEGSPVICPLRARADSEAFHHEQTPCQSDAQLFNGSEQRVLSHTRVIALSPPHDSQEGIWAIPMLASA